MENRLVYSPLAMLFMFFFAFLLFAVVGLLFLDLARTAFTKIGFSWSEALIVLLACLLGSGINIPLTKMECSIPMVTEKYVRAFGVSYKVPVVENVNCGTILAINVGGAAIPALISIGLVYRFPESFFYALGGVIFVAAIVHHFARPVKGLGIVNRPCFRPLRLPWPRLSWFMFLARLTILSFSSLTWEGHWEH